MKTCSRCGQEKPIEDFYKRPGTTDGHEGKCKQCCKVYEIKRRRENPARHEFNQQTSRDRYRLLALRVVGNSDHPVCARCGCDDIRFLEISHKEGGGRKESANGLKGLGLALAIVKGRREVDDLELLCKPCNGIHALEMKYGPVGLQVVWNTQSVEMT